MKCQVDRSRLINLAWWWTVRHISPALKFLFGTNKIRETSERSLVLKSFLVGFVVCLPFNVEKPFFWSLRWIRLVFAMSVVVIALKVTSGGTHWNSRVELAFEIAGTFVDALNQKWTCSLMIWIVLLLSRLRFGRIGCSHCSVWWPVCYFDWFAGVMKDRWELFEVVFVSVEVVVLLVGCTESILLKTIVVVFDRSKRRCAVNTSKTPYLSFC